MLNKRPAQSPTDTPSYDPVDNRLTSSETGFVTSWTYDLTSRMQTALTNTGVSSYTYMTDGNLQIVLDPGAFTTMGYDTENRLATHQSSAGQTNYLYYGDNIHFRKRLVLRAGRFTNL